MTGPDLPSPPPLRVLIIDGHPRHGSLCQALAEAFRDGAAAAGREVRLMELRNLRFDPNELGGPPEPDVETSRQCLLWADHVTVVTPVWWGVVPALLKGWLDRVLGCGFAFEERDDGTWEGLLRGRTGLIILTMDTPRWIFRWLLGAPAVRALRDATLAFCGITPVQVLMFGPVRDSAAAKRTDWLEAVRAAGGSLDRRFHTGVRARLRAWTRIARLQFYAFPALAVLAGAFAGTAARPDQRSWALAWLTVLGAMLVELVTVLTNEIHDLPADTANRNSGPFTGGSRVLVERRLTVPQVRRGRQAALLLLAGIAVLIAVAAPHLATTLLGLLAVGLMAGLAYTAPPLRLICRGWGELTVAATHSVIVVLAGYASQWGAWTDGMPWRFTAPMFLAIFPSIILAGFPDLEADEAVGKRTLAVRLGSAHAAWLALAFVLGAALLHLLTFAAEAPFLINLVILAHALALAWRLTVFARRPRPGRIDGLLFLGLGYMVWFALGPLLRYWNGNA